MAGSGVELTRLRKELESSSRPGFSALRDYLRQARCADCYGAQRAAELCVPCCPPLVTASPLSGALPHAQVRLLRVRDVEGVTKYGMELLSKHSRKLEVDEREWDWLLTVHAHPTAAAVPVHPASSRCSCSVGRT
jgi:hypothetical protein